MTSIVHRQSRGLLFLGPKWGFPIAIAMALTLYTAFLAIHVGAYAGGCDTSDYLNNARLLGEGRTHAEMRLPPGVDAGNFKPDTFIPYGSFRPTAGIWMAPIHPCGLPVFIWLVSTVTGWSAAPHVTMVAMALLGMLATAWLAREFGLPRSWAWVPAALLAVSPLYLCMSLHLMSDVPALVCVTFAVIFVWKSRSKSFWALAAGVMFAIAVIVRQTNMLAIFPVVFCLGKGLRRWIFFILGGLPGAVALWCYNQSAYGHAWETGYTGIPSAWVFSLHAAPANLIYYIRWMPVLATPVGILVLGLPWLLREAPLKVMVLVAWILPFLAFYVFFDFTSMVWWMLRYLLPAFPAFLVGGTWVLRSWLEGFFQQRAGGKMARGVGLSLILAIAVFEGFWSARLEADGSGRFHSTFPAAASWANAHLPPNSVILGMEVTGSFYYYTRFPVIRADQLDEEHWSVIEEASAKSGWPLYAVLIGADPQEILEKGKSGAWTRMNERQGFTLWRFDKK